MRSEAAKLAMVGGLAVVLILGGKYLGNISVSTTEIVRRYHLMMAQNPGMRNMTWLGVPAIQNPNDVWITQEIIAQTKPDFIVETGTAQGGSALIWAMIQREVNSAGRVITIDVEDMVQRKQMPAGLLERIDFIVGSSVDPAVISTVRDKVKGGKAMVILDSDHSRGHVLRELIAYAPLVAPGCYIIVQDTDRNGHPVVVPNEGPGPMEAVEEFLASNDSFVSDRTREKLLYTVHPKGYLKRIR